MSYASPKRTRSQRVATLELPPGEWGRWAARLQEGSVMLRIALCALSASILLFATRGWLPAFEFRPHETPLRNVVAAQDFREIDDEATRLAKEEAMRFTEAVYDHDPEPLTQLKAEVQNDLAELAAFATWADVDQELWANYTPALAAGTPEPSDVERQAAFDKFKAEITGEEVLPKIQGAISEIFAPLNTRGVLDVQPTDASSERIEVRPNGKDTFALKVPVSEVLQENLRNQLQKSLEQKLPSLDVANRVFARLKEHLPITLELNVAATRDARLRQAELTPPVLKVYEQGTVLAPAGKPIEEPELRLLRLEHAERLKQLTIGEQIGRAFAVLGMYLAVCTLCGFYANKIDPRLIRDLGRFITLLATCVLTVSVMLLVYGYGWRAQVIPLVLFAMTTAVAYQQELALLLTAALTLVSVVAMGSALPEAISLLATASGAILALDSVRTRSKLLVVGFLAAFVAFFTTLGVGAIAGQPVLSTLQLALMMALWSVIAGSLMTCLLPLVERVFQVQTDLSLIELGDPAHPLLQELVRRAPGTYNHSITVASIAQAAAESIGARGLLVRVGAYYHDIGKMLKPGYFVENQTQGNNRHDQLMPAMSTLVIIAHVKDGVDLARQNRLPESLVDFIQQHHGTTLVEYFYRQATDRNKANPQDAEVDESSFRYPGPKPQTKEAGVLMLSDAVESASRVLVEPTPSRLENLVEDLTRKRLADGQFDECGLTLQEVHRIGESLVKSLSAMYHGRVKYPDQESA
jgi:cyclic-di-AMP phosphodiesterase PgpH